MAQYKVINERCSLGEVGAIITPSDMSADNLAALVEGGFIEAVVSAKATKSDAEGKYSWQF
jgi:hypothetical protein